MPRGIYKRTDENRRMISEAKKGKSFSEEHKRKIGLANKGIVRTEEWNRKISETNKKNNVGKWMIGRKASKEAKEKMSLSAIGKHNGSKNPNWLGGKSFELYTINWTDSLKISIRERDKYTCKICGEKQGDITHHIHHINYIKTDCNPKNLVTLCKSCHARTNTNRDYWINYFKITQTNQ